MFHLTTILLALLTCVTGFSVVLQDADSKKLRSFTFEDDPPSGDPSFTSSNIGVQTREQNPEMYSDVSSLLERQGIVNGTLIIVPTVNGTTCTCIPTGVTCTGGGVYYGDNNLDVRIVNTAGTTQTGSTLPISATPVLTVTLATQVTTCQASILQLCCITGGYQCGMQYTAVTGSATPPSGSSYFGQYPWQAVLLTTGDVYVGSGVLIDGLNVLTVAHRVTNYINGGFLKVRLGEWDASSTTEPIAAQEYTVSRVFVNPSYISTNLRNDIAILRLATRVTLGTTPTIAPACLTSSLVTSGRCYISGWGRNQFVNGVYQPIQKQTDIPIVAQDACQTQLRQTRLTAAFTLDTTSFMCAGGEAGKDACTGDGGAPLVCSIGGRFYAVGLVSWGIGCGNTSIPGVYVNIASYISWIQTTLLQ